MQKLFVLLSFFFSLSAHAEIEFNLFKNKKSEIKFDHLSTEDRQILIKESKLIFSKIYVNLEHKRQYWNADPVGALVKLEKNFEQLSDLEFHAKMLEVYASVHDFHVNYNLPKPYACHAVVLPVFLWPVDGQKIVVRKIDKDRSDLVPELDKISIGDELVAYDGKNPLDVIKSRMNIVGASSPDSIFLQGMYDLYWRGLNSTIAPDKDEVALTFKNANGSYSITLPWIAKSDTECLSEDKENNFSKTEGSKIDELRERTRYIESVKTPERSTDKELSVLNSVDISELNQTKNPSMNWKVIHYKSASFAYLRLDSFGTPSPIHELIDEIRALLEGEFKDTQGLVLDLRGNYGGQIDFAEKLVSLLTPNPVKPHPFFIRANDLMINYFKEGSAWKELIAPSVATDTIVGPGFFTTELQLSQVPQAYFAKVALLTNSECFSSCDLFSGLMKDVAHVKLYGTDRATFGGGANVWATDVLNQVLKNYGLPETLPQNISMRATVRHAHRLSTGKLIEDAGVESDVVIKETMNDILYPKTSSVVAKIFDDFLKDPNQKTSSETTIATDSDFFVRHGNEEFNLTATTSNVSSVNIVVNKQLIGTKQVGSDKGISIPMAKAPLGFDLVELIGINGNKTVVRRPVIIENLPAFKLQKDFDFIRDSASLNMPKEAGCGWEKTDNGLNLANPYCSSMASEAVGSVELTTAAKLSFDLNLSSEEGFDFFKVLIVADGHEEFLIEPVSGSLQKHFEFDLSKFAGKQIDLVFRFDADEEITGDTQTTITNLKLE